MAARTFLVLLCLGLVCRLRAREVEYGRDVLPILSDACYHCHGPDEKARKAELRLDTREGVFRTKEGITVVAPGKLEESDLVARITSSDPDDQMPPPKAHRKLTAEEVETLRQWVAGGAKWGQPWAFTAIKKATPPKVRRAGWAKNEIDAFVLAGLEAAGLEPSPEADKARLLRRVTFDLTGLPPSIDEIHSFLSDFSPEAYTKVVDRLLASPRYGERMAVEWLDIARYADTHGYQADRYRAMWPWRDWVIKSFNANLPYDQFVTDQLAGDLLPNATPEQKLATAFNRLHNQNEEGGIVEEEYRVAYVVDRVNTFGTAMLGLTFECSRCHDHKFDPITQRDYYSLFSFFQNIDEAGQITWNGFADVMPVPTLLLTSAEQDVKLRSLGQAARLTEKELDQSWTAAAAPAFEQWLADKGDPPPALPGEAAAFDFESLEGGKLINSADPAKPGKLSDNPKLVPGRHGLGAELDGENGFTFPGIAHFRRSDSFSLSLWLKPPEKGPRLTVVHHTKAPADAASRGYELMLEDGHVAFALHYIWPEASLKVISRAPLVANEWTHVTATYDGSSRAAGAHIYINGTPAPVDVVKDNLYKDISYTNGEPDLTIGYRFRDSGFKGGVVDDFHVFDRAVTPLEAGLLAGRGEFLEAWNSHPEALDAWQRESLFEFYSSALNPASLEAAQKLRRARQAESDFLNGIPEIMVMKELTRPKPAYVLKRGAYDAHGQEVSADTPKALPPFPADLPRNRLGLARWLFDSGNPLPARVAVNRLWQLMFGVGIVETSDNFGAQGIPPTHPELLDWLARAYVESGWDTKAMLRCIALSATYRESSKASPESLGRDPQNTLFTRGPARRLTAEMLRDQALADGGLLVEKLGGPSVKPYQPAGLWEEIAMGRPHYDQGHGEDLHRRSLYTFWKRTVPPPVMVTFDAAERNTCIVRRQSTGTPLQALALLNDVQIVEAARLIGQRMLKEGGADLDGQIEWAFELVTGRAATDPEKAVLQRLYKEQLEIFTADQAAAEKLAGVGEAPADPALPKPQLAASAVLAKAILNFDESVMRR